MIWPNEQWDRGRKLGCRGDCTPAFLAAALKCVGRVLVPCLRIPIKRQRIHCFTVNSDWKKRRASSVKNEKQDPMWMNIPATCTQTLKLIYSYIYSMEENPCFMRTFSRNCALLWKTKILFRVNTIPLPDSILTSLIHSTNSNIIYLINPHLMSAFNNISSSENKFIFYLFIYRYRGYFPG
jgi:hypothetical protein